MARYALIDGYLETMRSKIHWRGDLDDVVAEMEDHLYSTVEHLLARGSEVGAAQRATLDRFGDPKVLATAYASTDRGGIAVPTSFTRTAGKVAQVAAALLLVLPVLWGVAMLTESRTGTWAGVETMLFMIGSLCLMAAAALIVFVAVGLIRRHGGLGVPGLLGVGLCGLGILAAFVSWFIAGWSAVIGAGLLVLAMGMLRRGLTPVAPTIALGGGMLLGLATFLVLDTIGVGAQDEWGDHPLAIAIGVWTMTLITATGLFGIGRWLLSEEPADVDATLLAA